MDLIAELRKYPERLQSNISVSKLNEPIEIVRQGLALRVKKDAVPGQLDGVMSFGWMPRTIVEFEGIYRGERPEIGSDQATLFMPKVSSEIPVVVTNLSQGDSGWKIRGVLKGSAVRSTGVPAEKLIFHLVNFPDYIGLPIRTESDRGIGAFAGRLTFENDQWIGFVDSIPETSHLGEEQKQNGGFYISHVGEIRAKNNQYLDENQLDSICSNLRYLFGFCRGTWCGPLFPQGIRGNEIVWQPLAAWRTGTPQRVPTWFPTRTRIGKFSLFSAFMDKINDPVWKSPLSNAISWYVDANKPEIANEGRIVLMQVALEMLSWAFFVDSGRSYTVELFGRLPAHKKIRKLLAELKIPTVIPKHLNELQKISRETLHKDAPGSLSTIRNALVHSTKENRRIVSQLNGTHLHQIAQMGIGFVEQVILALCEYEGSFARRGWRGWKGDDETSVPWAEKRRLHQQNN
jgi:hypothetical protein